MSNPFSKEDAIKLGNRLNIDWEKIKLSEFHDGLAVELEHGKISPKTNVTNDDPLMTAKIALAHLNEIPNYYTLLDKMEKIGKKSMKKSNIRQKAGAMLRKGFKKGFKKFGDEAKNELWKEAEEGKDRHEAEKKSLKP
jgi:hypothetical protein